MTTETPEHEHGNAPPPQAVLDRAVLDAATGARFLVEHAVNTVLHGGYDVNAPATVLEFAGAAVADYVSTDMAGCGHHGCELGHALRLVSVLTLKMAEVVHRPVIVTICGSTRFRDEIALVNRMLTLNGGMVFAPGVFQHAGDEITDQQKCMLDQLHLKKIDVSDEVFVVNPGGYLGESTRREIEYAVKTGKPITYLVDPPPAGGEGQADELAERRARRE